VFDSANTTLLETLAENDELKTEHQNGIAQKTTQLEDLQLHVTALESEKAQRLTNLNEVTSEKESSQSRKSGLTASFAKLSEYLEVAQLDESACLIDLRKWTRMQMSLNPK